MKKTRIHDFLQGAVFCWCKNRPNEWFSLRDLVGGVNWGWDKTPLTPLYTKNYIKLGDDKKAIKQAGKDCGWMLKQVIVNDGRIFETKQAELTRKYRWIPKT